MQNFGLYLLFIVKQKSDIKVNLIHIKVIKKSVFRIFQVVVVYVLRTSKLTVDNPLDLRLTLAPPGLVSAPRRPLRPGNEKLAQN